MYSVFEDHLGGGLFIDNDYEPETCSQCGDTDWFIGNFDNYKQLIEHLADEDGWTGYEEEYLKGLFEEVEEERTHDV